MMTAGMMIDQYKDKKKYQFLLSGVSGKGTPQLNPVEKVKIIEGPETRNKKKNKKTPQLQFGDITYQESYAAAMQHIFLFY
jgi:hypothetical protein